MSNEQIKELFTILHENQEDALDVLMCLGAKRDEYNESEFAKETGLSIYEAYTLYFRTALTVPTIIKIFQGIVDGLDFSKINGNLSIQQLFDEIPEEYKPIFKEVFQAFQETEI